ncbi:MmcQ/YjbR family DNA-binding protein [Saccharopolyspora sp. CA-218241]|uniref:MmcQ/YjbR family DNA-binding protein n=1 Tax=Saccharopolyspora sp. CA-218241 TaxID=3240027 RepID=UPI003D96BE86
MATEDDVRRIALSLPGAYERESYGGCPSWRTKARVFSWIRDDPEALVVWVASVEEKEELIASDPGTFFTTSHYDGHPVVLVRLDDVDADELRELIEESWRLRAPRTLSANRDRAPGR